MLERGNQQSGDSPVVRCSSRIENLSKESVAIICYTSWFAVFTVTFFIKVEQSDTDPTFPSTDSSSNSLDGVAYISKMIERYRVGAYFLAIFNGIGLLLVEHFMKVMRESWLGYINTGASFAFISLLFVPFIIGVTTMSIAPIGKFWMKWIGWGFLLKGFVLNQVVRWRNDHSDFIDPPYYKRYLFTSAGFGILLLFVSSLQNEVLYWTAVAIATAPTQVGILVQVMIKGPKSDPLWYGVGTCVIIAGGFSLYGSPNLMSANSPFYCCLFVQQSVLSVLESVVDKIRLHFPPLEQEEASVLEWIRRHFAVTSSAISDTNNALQQGEELTIRWIMLRLRRTTPSEQSQTTNPDTNGALQLDEAKIREWVRRRFPQGQTTQSEITPPPTNGLLRTDEEQILQWIRLAALPSALPV